MASLLPGSGAEFQHWPKKSPSPGAPPHTHSPLNQVNSVWRFPKMFYILYVDPPGINIFIHHEFLAVNLLHQFSEWIDTFAQTGSPYRGLPFRLDRFTKFCHDTFKVCFGINRMSIVLGHLPSHTVHKFELLSWSVLGSALGSVLPFLFQY